MNVKINICFKAKSLIGEEGLLKSVPIDFLRVVVLIKTHPLWLLHALYICSSTVFTDGNRYSILLHPFCHFSSFLDVSSALL